MKTTLLVFLFFLMAETAYFQNRNLFEVKRLTMDIRTSFNLSPRDIKAIERLIDQENRRVVKIYARFTGDQPEYSSRLWMQLIDDRLAFEAGMEKGLTARQKAALRSARSRMEKRILEYLVNDYVGFLAQVLELDEFEFNDVTALFAFEVEKKCRLLNVLLANPVLLQKEMEKLSHETEYKLQQILSGERWRYYRELTEPFELIA